MDPFQSPAQRRRYWNRHLRAWRRSGLTQAEYARQHHISPKSLSYWSGRGTSRRSIGPRPVPPAPAPSAEGGPEVKFVPVPHDLLAPSRTREASGHLVLRVGPRLRLTIPGDISPDTLTRVVQVLLGLS